MEHGDATCFLRIGYEVIGGPNGNRRGKVVGSATLSADVLWDDGETETVDQFTHTLFVIDRGQPLPHAFGTTVRRTKPLKRAAWKRKPPAPEKAKAAKRRQQKRAKERQEEDFGPHGEWVRERGCEVRNCFAPAEAHHDPFRSQGGTAKDLVGLCLRHHREGRLARHKTSLAKFNEAWQVDLRAAAERNWAESPFGARAQHG